LPQKKVQLKTQPMSKIQEKTDQRQEKDTYKVVNWSSYNKSLKSRGSLTIWLDKNLEKTWYDNRKALKGGQYVYSDTCLLILLQLRAVYKLPLRQLQGFCESLFELMGMD